MSDASNSGPSEHLKPGESDAADCKWVGYELHDGLIQWVVSARMQIDVLTDKAAAGTAPPEMLADRLASTKQLLEAALDEGRQLINYLENPQSASSSNLAVRLLHFIHRIEVDAEVNQQTLRLEGSADDWPSMNPHTEWNVLRILQQAIANAVQHAGPCHIRIRRCPDDNGGKCFIVEDDGRGFDPASDAPENHFGLAAMQHRASLLAAQLDIESAAERGTTVRLRLPR